MENIKKVIASYNYILIDMTPTIKTLYDLGKLIEKAHNTNKYKKVVFMLNMKNVPIEIIEYYQSIRVLPDLLQRNTVMLYNKDNYIFFDLEMQLNITTIKKFIEDSEDLTNCPVCFETKDNFTLCHNCSVAVCHNCIKKMNKPDCVICKNKHHIILY